MVIEVAYSQKERDIPHLADNYILKTNGSIRAVVGLNIDYKMKRGTVSMWRPKYTKNEQGEIEVEAAEIIKDQVYLMDTFFCHAILTSPRSSATILAPPTTLQTLDSSSC